MKIALITTTINVPKVLALYREIGPDVEFFVAGDRKSPHEAIRAFLKGVPNAHYFSDIDQESMCLASSEIIGWNTIMRRNFALFVAIKSRADIIVTIDDDNIPVSRNYFDEFRQIFSRPFCGLQVETDNRSFDVGQLLLPKVHHRGFPYDRRGISPTLKMTPVSQATVGVAAGLWVGDPDIDAMARITNAPAIHNMSEVLQHGIVVAKDNLTVFNSQNTAFRRELAPLMMVWTAVGRYDDIWASYFAQFLMQTTSSQIHFGKPFVWQDRNPQNLWRNLKDEMLGMEMTPRFLEDLWAIDAGKDTMLDRMRRTYDRMASFDYLPPAVCKLGRAWCDDLESIL